MTHNETQVSNERLGSIITGLKTRLSAGASGAPDMDRDLISALAELQALRANPSPSDGEVSDRVLELARDVYEDFTGEISSKQALRLAINCALQASKRGQP